MRRNAYVFLTLAVIAAAPACAQPDERQSVLASALPSPEIGENASTREYLIAARAALAEGRTGEAQESLEMAETRTLDRSVPLFHTADPSDDPMVADLRTTLRLLGEGDRFGAMKNIEGLISRTGDNAAN